MGNKYILGAGLSSLCYAFYNPDYILIGEETGGRLNKDLFKNIIYVHKTLETERFLQDVGINYKVKTQLIKYLKDNKVTQSIDTLDKINIIRKKLDDKDLEIKDLTLSTQDYYITILEFSFGDLINKIKEKVKIINEKVIRVTAQEIITENSSYEYSNIVSTLPANIFWKLYYKDKSLELKSKSVTFVLCDKEPNECTNISYDMLYVLDSDKRYNRISKKPGERNENRFLYEFTGEIPRDNITEYLPEDSNILEYYVDKQGIIYTNKNNIAPPNILFVGRFAEYNHRLKTQDVIKQALWSYDLRHVWNRQQTFMSNRLDFNNLEKLEDKEKETQTLLLHLHAEVSEVLDCINYKLHKKRHEVDINHLKEELIDAQKYLLNLFILWDVSAQDFIDLFNKKSKIVEERFEREFKK